MASKIKNMYTAKAPKKVRDPSLPPAPTLLGQVKDLRLTKETIEATQLNMMQQREQIAALNRKLAHAMYRIELLTTNLRNKRS